MARQYSVMHGTVHTFVNNPTWKVFTYQRFYGGCKQCDAVSQLALVFHFISRHVTYLVYKRERTRSSCKSWPAGLFKDL